MEPRRLRDSAGLDDHVGGVERARRWVLGVLADGDRHAILAISPRSDLSAEVAQLVEHVTENHGVGSSILPLGTKIPKEIEDFRVRAATG